jgi:UDP-glucose 4-epimerase
MEVRQIMKILVTGGAGFIGSSIVKQLLENNYEVIIIDNLTTGELHNVRPMTSFYPLDITSNELEKVFLLERPEIVIHQAAQVSVQQSITSPSLDCHVNIAGTINILNACVKYKVKKLIYSSTAAVYGAPNYLPIDEDHPILPMSFYGLSKLTSERYIQLFSQLYNLKYTILRYANVYGPNQNLQGEAGVIALFIKHMLNDRSLTIFGDGNQTRDFVYVKDVAAANILAIQKGDNQIFNISSNTQISITNLIDILSDLHEKEIKRNFEKPRPGDIINSLLLNQKAKRGLGWSPKFTLESGLKETINYFNKGF